jgi:hypothetical protein
LARASHRGNLYLTDRPCDLTWRKPVKVFRLGRPALEKDHPDQF